jgi:murein DD-endopeptidase MepM/ murein hydrolase activator NlpD
MNIVHRFTSRRLLLAALLLALLLVLCPPTTALAQESGSYTVEPGDTISAIAARFGVSMESLLAANSITNPDLLQVGQTLLIPGVSIQPDIGAVATTIVLARPGDTLGAVAARLGQDSALLASLNTRITTGRLFPGQPVLAPEGAVPAQPLRFGAITAISMPNAIPQGRTGTLVVESSRPLTLTADWNGLPLPLAPLDAPTRQVALLPAPALLGPGDFSLVLGYTTRSGVPVTMTLPLAVVDGGYESQVITVPADRTDLLSPENTVDEEAKVRAAWSGFSTDLVLRAAFERPIDTIYETTSPFGTRRYYDSAANSLSGYHAGQDFGAPPGITVTAPAAGWVVLAEPLTVRGNAVIMDHGRGVFSGFWHLSEIKVTPGQFLNAGDTVGLVGNTGLSTGAHLHWELRIDGIAVDPMQFLDEPVFPPPEPAG